MIALADCNNFFCSVEKVFHPGLADKPVCVLSNNDGCIISLTPEAKKLGLHRGDPIFKVRDIVEHNNVTLFSNNMYLYAAMSQRIFNIFRSAVPFLEKYSIDECILYLNGYERNYNLEDYMRSVADKVKLYTDIPVSIGIAPSKTLAKMGSKFAKQYKGYRNVCMIDTDEKRRKALQLFDLSSVWGIGRHTLAKLNYLGIHTPFEFAEKKESWVKANFHKPGYQTWLELNGIPCIETAEAVRNQSICTSRSFGNMISDLASLKASVATFASSCANKLRAQNARARTVTVLLYSNRFREDLDQYNRNASFTLRTPTSDTMEIAHAALQIVEKIYQPGIWYKKSGVIVSDISGMENIQYDLFDPIRNRNERAVLMKTIDKLNHRYGLNRVRLAVEGEKEQPWKLKSEFRSGNYLSDLNEILTIKI